MSDCIFCRIANGDVPARFVFQDDDVVAFHDLAPQAPWHLLLVPRRHLASLGTAIDDDAALLGRLLATAARLAREHGFGDAFRLVVNSGAPAGQSVFHLHLHLLGGRAFGWPPG
jgi:histidine triad (HIT) family protein